MKKQKNKLQAIPKMKELTRYSCVPAFSIEEYKPSESVDDKNFLIILKKATFIIDTTNNGQIMPIKTKSGVIAYRDREQTDEHAERYIAEYQDARGIRRTLVLFKNNIDTVIELC